MERRDLSAMAKIVGLAVAAYADKDGQAFPTLPQIAADLSICVSSADKYLDELRAAKVLTWTLYRDEQRQQRRRYSLVSREGKPSERLFLPPSDWDGLGGKAQDGRRTMHQ